MTDRELAPTHSAFLELKAERAGMQEGYRFLDEKRLILAGEILANMRAYDAAQAEWRQAQTRAREALRGAVGRHGLDELGLYPAAAATCGLATVTRSVLGVRIEQIATPADAAAEALRRSASVDPSGVPAGERAFAGGSAPPAGAAPPAMQSPEADAAREAFAALLPIAARLAVLSGNLQRLRVEYLRTSRRARALEDVLLPETDARLAAIDTALEELEREEAVRVRWRGGAMT
jgi:V/A-type H+-transporting ATPase subunit D